jgi:1,2-diacylglycerol 3-alpha-glucosyltransferase
VCRLFGMNIVMMTNTYKPITGGLERSIETLTTEVRGRGHNVMIVVPQIDKDMPLREPGVFHVPALTHVNRTPFPVQLPIPSELSSVLASFAPDIIHSHHPFLIGDTALRASARFGTPLVFTMHTLYEQYTHYLPLDSASLKRFMAHLASGYANLCDHVFAPSRSVAELLARRGVTTPVSVVPTGIQVGDFERGGGREFREAAGIPLRAFVAGFVGRIASEKNIDFLMQAAAAFMEDHPDVHFLVAGAGPMAQGMAGYFDRGPMRKRFHPAGVLRGRQLINAYHAMDVFAFPSVTETQGLVLAESMAAGVPVVSLDGPGTRDIVVDGVNGFLLGQEDIRGFCRALEKVRAMGSGARQAMREACIQTARRYSARRIADRVLGIYDGLIGKSRARKRTAHGLASASHLIKAEWMLMLNMARAAGKAVLNT